MNVEFITKQDIQSIEQKLNSVVNMVQAQRYQGLVKVYTTKELSEKLKVSTKTLNNWREARLIQFSKIHNTILFTEEAVLEFLAAHTIKRRSNIVNRLNATPDGNGKK